MLMSATAEKVEKTISMYSDMISKEIEEGSPGAFESLPAKISALAELVSAARS